MIVRLLATLALACCTLGAHAATPPVDVNKASRTELEALPGVGPALSGKITEARKSGEFRDWNDLVGRVKGVGPASATRLSQAGLTVSGVAYRAGAAEAPAAKSGGGAQPPKPIALSRKAEAADSAKARSKAAEGTR